MLEGIVFFIIAVIVCDKLKIIGLILTVILACSFFSKAYAMFVCGLCVMHVLGRGINKDSLDLPYLNLKYGGIFEAIGFFIALAGLVMMIINFFK